MTVMEAESKRFVLLVEDDAMIRGAMGRSFAETITSLEADTLEEAKKMFVQNADRLDLVLLDATLDEDSYNYGDPPQTANLASFIRASGFKRPVVAISGDPKNNEKLVQAGCNEGVEKLNLRDWLKDWLRQTSH